MEDDINMKPASLALVVATASALLVTQARAAEIRVLSTPTLKTTLDELGPKFERATGHKLVTKFDAVAVLKRQIEAGELFDVTILLPVAIDDLIKQGKVVGRTDISRSGVGVAVKAGATKPDVGSVDALKRTLLSANSISYSPDSASSTFFLGLADRLGIGSEVRPKLKAAPGGRVMEPVASGDADLTVITIPNIVGVPGVAVAGRLPAELQSYTVFSAGVGATAKEVDGAKELIRYLVAPEATAVFEAKGMERVPQ
jgi:molybdate transport system substrate-binding protein